MKSKRTGHDVLQQLHTVIGFAQAHPALVETATHSMTPEQLRKAHEGLMVLANCIGAIKSAMPVTIDKAPRAVRATEST